MKQVLITGAEGFIGTNLIFKLHQKYGNNIKIVGVDSGINSSTNSSSTNQFVEHNKFDLRDTDKLTNLMKRGCDLVVHLAAKGNVVESVDDPIENFECNVVSMMSVLEAMRSSNVKNIVFSSTGGALMGNTPPPVNEQSVPNPISPYGASKMACEGYISAYAGSYGLNASIARFGNVYGSWSSHKKGVVNKWLMAAINNEPIEIYGTGHETRDYIHVSDIAEGLIALMELIDQKSIDTNCGQVETFHLANSEEVSLLDLSKHIQTATDKDINIIFKDSRAGEVKETARRLYLLLKN